MMLVLCFTNPGQQYGLVSVHIHSDSHDDCSLSIVVVSLQLEFHKDRKKMKWHVKNWRARANFVLFPVRLWVVSCTEYAI